MSSRLKTHNALFDLFPPPSFIQMPAIGLDMSDRVVRVAELKRRKNSLRVGLYDERKIPKGVIEEGYVKEKDALIKILTSLREDHSLKFIRASLPEEKAYLFRTRVPMMDVADIRGALQFKIEENVPVSLKDAVYDFRIITEPKPGDTTIDVSVTVLHTKVVSSYLEVFTAAGLTPLELFLESHAMARILFSPADPDTHVIVAVRETKTVLAIVAHSMVQFTSTLDIGGESIAESIKKNFSVNEAEADNIRKGKEVKESNEMFLSLVNAESALRDEIQKLFSYWDGHRSEGDGPIKNIVLMGSDALLGLDDYLARSLQVPVEIANAWAHIMNIDTELPPITRRESLDYIPALGLAMPHD